jgi:DNA-directed RNA polymerase subunit RPC12/RpoP
MYLVVLCYRCGQLLLAKTTQKTRSCPRCEARLFLEKAKKVAHAKSASEASSLIRTLKKKRRRFR